MFRSIYEQLLSLLQPLPVPVPPLLERALGYEGDSRFVAFYWIPDGDELMFDDVRISGTGEWSAWLTYTTHPSVAPHLEGLNFGNAEEVAELYFLLDRQERRAYAGDIMPVMRLLAQQHLMDEQVDASETAEPQIDEEGVPAATPTNETDDWLAALDISTWQEVKGPDVPDVQHLMAERQRLEDEMRRWLDGQFGQVSPQYSEEEPARNSAYDSSHDDEGTDPHADEVSQ